MLTQLDIIRTQVHNIRTLADEVKREPPDKSKIPDRRPPDNMVGQADIKRNPPDKESDRKAPIQDTGKKGRGVRKR